MTNTGSGSTIASASDLPFKVMREKIDDKLVDLVYLAPPFTSVRCLRTAAPGSREESAARQCL
jgi:hypothetical protein